ncbi:DUF1349 domain-containing protein [Allorhizocola rhizosphaerae]|uniref:DUF1349 domain-containing protein n=1 Tax=Allorhizocola rhizosphaerae TaxID=1872709 RepID=UPI000E3CD6E3|nr:DUF1349 domain-containing protein [Allorhizocola rhizosphaerae]
MDLVWDVEPASWSADGDTWTVTAAAGTDCFIDPAGTTTVLNGARALIIAPDGPWQFWARVSVEFKGMYDAGVLMLWADDRRWAKLCFERSPQGAPMVVSVITRDVSDDANAWVVDSNTTWLRISHLGDGVYAFHAGDDGVRWEFVRYFHLGPAKVGIEVQAPVGEGCTATFANLTLVSERLSDLRDGS